MRAEKKTFCYFRDIKMDLYGNQYLTLIVVVCGAEESRATNSEKQVKQDPTAILQAHILV